MPAAAANLPNGKVILWSAETRFSFNLSNTGRTYTTIFDPATQSASETLVSSTGHNMFCPGTTNLPDGRLLISGGIDNLFDRTYAEHISKAGSMIAGYTQTTRVNEPGRTAWLKAQIALD